MGSVRRLLTLYGYRELDVASLHGSAVLYTLADHEIPAGTEWDGDRKLKTPVRWRHGTILVPRLLKTDGPQQGVFLWSAFPYGIYEALRALMHTKHGYRGVEEGMGIEERSGEVERLEVTRDELDLALGWLALRPQLTRYRREAIKALIREQVVTVGQVRDPAKRNALEHMLQTLHDRDSRGRPNPSARMAIVVGAQNDLRDRLDLIRFIEPRMGAREIALLLEAVRIRRIFGYAYRTTCEIRGGARIRNRFDWLTRIDVLRRELTSIRVGPYPVHIERLDGDMERAQTALRHGDITEVRRLLGIVTESLRCKKARWVLEEFLVKLSLFARQREPDPEVAMQFVREIRHLSERVASRIDDTGFKKPVREPVRGLLETAASLLEKPGQLTLRDAARGAKGLVECAARRL